MYVIYAKTDDDYWCIGPFDLHGVARETMLALDAKYGESIEYEVIELFEPRSYVDDLDPVAAVNG